MFIIAKKTFPTEYSIKLDALINAGRVYNKARADFMKLRRENIRLDGTTAYTEFVTHSNIKNDIVPDAPRKKPRIDNVLVMDTLKL